jgi:hypothetical protein
VVERSDTTGRLLPPPLHPEGVPATLLIRPDRNYFGMPKKENEIGPMISLGLLFGLRQPTTAIHTFGAEKPIAEIILRHIPGLDERHT